MAILYGSSVADSTITTACKMSTTTGGTETSKQTTFSSTGNFAEITSKGGSVSCVASIPSNPTGNGWVYSPGAGSFAAGNWSASCAFKAIGSNLNNSLTLRFFKYSGGAYTSIGNIVNSTNGVGVLRTVISFAATSMSAVTFGGSDLLYVDVWWEDSAGASGDNPTVYESSSASNGVANDMQVTTTTFTAGGTRMIICDGFGGMFR